MRTPSKEADGWLSGVQALAINDYVTLGALPLTGILVPRRGPDVGSVLAISPEEREGKYAFAVRLRRMAERSAAIAAGVMFEGWGVDANTPQERALELMYRGRYHEHPGRRSLLVLQLEHRGWGPETYQWAMLMRAGATGFEALPTGWEHPPDPITGAMTGWLPPEDSKTASAVRG